MPDETILDRNRLTAFRLIGYPLHPEPQPPNVPRAAAVVFLARFCYHKANRQMLQYDSNRTALWELNRRLELGVLN